MKPILTITLAVFFLLSCSKEKETIPVISPRIPELWEKYTGNYQVYDTIGNDMYQMTISHYIGYSQTSGNEIDSLLINNFADTFDLRFQFTPSYVDLAFSQEFLHIGFHDSIVDYNNKSWGIWGLFYDTTTTILENSLINDTIIFYFEQDNIKYYINEAQPYYNCKCKHIAVKQ